MSFSYKDFKIKLLFIPRNRSDMPELFCPEKLKYPI